MPKFVSPGGAPTGAKEEEQDKSANSVIGCFLQNTYASSKVSSLWSSQYIVILFMTVDWISDENGKFMIFFKR